MEEDLADEEAVSKAVLETTRARRKRIAISNIIDSGVQARNGKSAISGGRGDRGGHGRG